MEVEEVNCNGNVFTIDTYNDISVIIHKIDGYYNGTKMASDNRKQTHFARFMNGDKMTEIIEYWKDIYNYDDTVLPFYTINEGISTEYNYLRGTYVHPNLIHFVAEWCSIEYAFKIQQLANQINETYHAKNTSFDEERTQILQEMKEKISKCTNPQPIGKIGEDYVFDYLKKFIPDLENVRGETHATDFHSKQFNIRFEIKTSKSIVKRDYNKMLYDYEFQNPNLIVMISNIADIGCPKLHLTPNILIINFSDLSELWINFILKSEWNNLNKITEDLKCDRMNGLISTDIKIKDELCNIVNKLSSMINTTSNNNSVSSIHPPIYTQEHVTAAISKEVKKISEDITPTIIKQAKESIDTSLTKEREESVHRFVSSNPKFKTGYNTHHLKQDYVKFCQQNSLPHIEKTNVLNDEIRKYCIQYQGPDKHVYKLKSESKDEINNVMTFLDEYELSNNKFDNYNTYKTWCEENGSVPLTKLSFNSIISEIN